MTDYKLKFNSETEAKQVLADYTYLDENGDTQWGDGVIAIPELREPSTLDDSGEEPVYVLGDVIEGYFVFLRSRTYRTDLTPYLTDEDLGVSFGPLPPPPSEVPLWAFRQVLIEDGLLDIILGAVSGNPVLVNYLEYGNFVDRSSPSLAAIATQLGKTSDEVDEMFRRAASIKL